jgi:hypothetical protein
MAGAVWTDGRLPSSRRRQRAPFFTGGRGAGGAVSAASCVRRHAPFFAGGRGAGCAARAACGGALRRGAGSAARATRRGRGERGEGGGAARGKSESEKMRAEAGWTINGPLFSSASLRPTKIEAD